MKSELEVRDELVRRGEALVARPRTPIPFTGKAEPDTLLNDLEGHPHAFVIACIMDRQIRAERAWLIPYAVAQRVGSFELAVLQRLSIARVRRIMERDRLHRFPSVMADNFHAAVQRIADVYEGNAGRIWQDRPSSAHLVWRFLEFQGVGPKIATMAANILVREFKVAVGDKISIDIAADVQVRRVFARLGLVRQEASPEEVIYRARDLNPTYPGVFDLAVWEIGRSWCRPTRPLCGDCYLQRSCPTGRELKGVGREGPSEPAPNTR